MFYGGLEKEEFDKVQKTLREKNSKMLFLASMVCSILFLGMFLSTFFDAKADSMDQLRMRSRMIYALMICVCGITMIVRNQGKRHSNQYVIVEWYIFLSILFGFAIWAGTTNQPHFPSVTFFVFLFALPFLIIERPIRLCSYLIGVSLIFNYSSWQNKTTELFEMDFMNCLCFLYLGLSFSVIMMVFKFKEVLQRIEIEEQRDRDELTGLLNKAAIEREVCTCLDARQKGYLVIMDIDDFKQINDTYGHLYGDTVLTACGKTLRKIFQPFSLIGRFGGDEFILYIRKENYQDILSLFEQEKEALKTTITLPIHDGTTLTISAGTVYYDGGQATYRQLFQQADKALYTAKQNGKNQIMTNTRCRDQQ